ncbi:hypothetical protein LTS17_003350 [Exophiala oligosperma]
MGCCSSKSIPVEDDRRPQVTPAPSVASTTSHHPNRQSNNNSNNSRHSQAASSHHHSRTQSSSIAGPVVWAGGAATSQQHSRNNTGSSNHQHQQRQQKQTRSQRGTHSTTFTEMLERAGIPDPGRDVLYIPPSRNIYAELRNKEIEELHARNQAEFWSKHKHWGSK